MNAPHVPLPLCCYCRRPPPSIPAGAAGSWLARCTHAGKLHSKLQSCLPPHPSHQPSPLLPPQVCPLEVRPLGMSLHIVGDLLIQVGGCRQPQWRLQGST